MNTVNKPWWLGSLLWLLAAAAIAEGPVGTWTLSIDTPRGTRTPSLVIREADGRYHGTLSGERGTQEIAEIAVDGDTFSFPLDVTMPMGTFAMTYSGTVEGDSLTGTIGGPRGGPGRASE